MAKLKGPLFSLGATGSIADTITFSKWKGIPTARQKSTPANPNTAGQQAQRSLMKAIVSFWRGYITNAAIKTGWNLAASTSGKAQSGFNAFTSAAVKVAAIDPDASFVGGAVVAFSAGTVEIDMKNLDDGAGGDEAGDFTVNFGSSPSQMTGSVDVAINNNTLEPNIGARTAGTVVYIRVIKTAGSFAGAPRSGIMAITVA